MTTREQYEELRQQYNKFLYERNAAHSNMQKAADEIRKLQEKCSHPQKDQTRHRMNGAPRARFEMRCRDCGKTWYE